MSVFVVTYVDEAGDTILPDDENLPRVLYSTSKDAEKVAIHWMKTFDRHRFVAYGEAYPYDQTSFEEELKSKQRATVGWITIEDEDGDKMIYAVQVISLRGAM